MLEFFLILLAIFLAITTFAAMSQSAKFEKELAFAKKCLATSDASLKAACLEASQQTTKANLAVAEVGRLRGRVGALELQYAEALSRNSALNARVVELETSPPVRIEIEHAKRVIEEYRRLNQLDVAGVVFFENGERVDPPNGTIEDWKCVGLCLSSYVEMDIYRDGMGKTLSEKPA